MKRKLMIIGIGNDHTGYELKLEIIKYFEDKGIEYKDFGSENITSDYPNYAKAVGRSIQKKNVIAGIIICGTGTRNIDRSE